MKATREQLETALRTIITAYENLQRSDGANIYFSTTGDSTAGDWVGRRLGKPIVKAELLLKN